MQCLDRGDLGGVQGRGREKFDEPCLRVFFK